MTGGASFPENRAELIGPRCAALRVLVVDDEDAIRRLIARYGAQQRWDVTAFARATDALALGSSFQTAILDVDIQDELDGIALARRLRAADPSLHIVMMSGDPGNEARVETSGLGPMLMKPFELSALDALVKSRASPK